MWQNFGKVNGLNQYIIVKSWRRCQSNSFMITCKKSMIIYMSPNYHIFGSLSRVVVVRLLTPMEGNRVTPIFRSLQNCQFHHRLLESLEHFNVLYIYIIIYFIFWKL